MTLFTALHDLASRVPRVLGAVSQLVLVPTKYNSHLRDHGQREWPPPAGLQAGQGSPEGWAVHWWIGPVWPAAGVSAVADSCTRVARHHHPRLTPVIIVLVLIAAGYTKNRGRCGGGLRCSCRAHACMPHVSHWKGGGCMLLLQMIEKSRKTLVCAR